MFTLGDLATILASPTGQPLPEMFLEATGSASAAFGLFFLSESSGVLLDQAERDSSLGHGPVVWTRLLSSCLSLRLGVSPS